MFNIYLFCFSHFTTIWSISPLLPLLEAWPCRHRIRMFWVQSKISFLMSSCQCCEGSRSDPLRTNYKNLRDDPSDQPHRRLLHKFLLHNEQRKSRHSRILIVLHTSDGERCLYPRRTWVIHLWQLQRALLDVARPKSIGLYDRRHKSDRDY